MLAQLRWHRLEVAVLKKFYPYANGINEYEDFLREIVASSNTLSFHIAEKSAAVFEEDRSNSESQLSELVEFQHAELEKINSRLLEGSNSKDSNSTIRNSESL